MANGPKRTPPIDEVPAERLAASWLVLLHQLPSGRSRPRVATWRRLHALGAVPLKNAAYVLPATAETREDFEWLRSEIRAAGGEATVLEVLSLPPDEVRAVHQAFVNTRNAEYGALARRIESVRRRAARSGTPDRRDVERRLRGFDEELRRILRRDFFGAPSRTQAERALAALGQLIRPASAEAVPRPLRPADYRRRIWVTRPRPGIDRLASAWLIRRFIDPSARFRFARGATIRGGPGVVRYDTFGGEFTHAGGRCTFEVLAQRFGIQEPAVAAIAEVVHDVDLKEERYRRPEAPAIARLVEGLRRSYPQDSDLIEHGIELFGWLFASFSAPRRA